MDIRIYILDMQVNTLKFVVDYLKRHGGTNIGAVVDRVNKLDAAAIERIIQFMLQGKQDADAAAWDIEQVMRRALM